MKYPIITCIALAAFACTSHRDNKPEEKKPVVVSLLGKEYFEPERSAKTHECSAFNVLNKAREGSATYRGQRLRDPLFPAGAA